MRLTTLVWSPQKAYFFKGASYLRYDLEQKRVDTGYPFGNMLYPRSIKGSWPGLAEAFPTGVDAAVVWPNGYAYFFKGDQYVRYIMDPVHEGVDQHYPKPIGGKGKGKGKGKRKGRNWPGLAEAFPDGIDAAVVWPDGRAYFFKGDRFVRYNVGPKNEGVDPAYKTPWPIKKGPWYGLADVFPNGIDAVIVAPDHSYAYFFRDTRFVYFKIDDNIILNAHAYPISGEWRYVMSTFNEALPDNIDITDNTTYWENTCRAVPPSQDDTRGKILVLPGQGSGSYLSIVIRRPIFDAAGKVDYGAASVVDPLPAGAYLRPHTDNHIVRLSDGSLLAAKSTFDFTPVPNPTSWQQLPLADDRPNTDGAPIGGRSGVAFWRSTDAISWQLQGVADPFQFAGGKYGYPSPLDCAGNTVDSLKDQCSQPGIPPWICAGGDRPEIYACPFTGYVYLVLAWFSGPYADNSVGPTPVVRNMLLLYSRDKGKSWDVAKDDFLDQHAPIVMTSTPNGRLFLYQWTSAGARIYFSNLFNFEAGAPPVISSPKSELPVTVKVLDKDVQLPCEFDKNLSVGQINHPAISRISTDATTSKVRVSYYVLNLYGRQEIRILNLEVKEDQPDPIVSFAAWIQPLHIDTHSITLGSFIDSDQIAFPSETDRSLFYWLEFPSKDSLNKDVYARYCVLDGEDFYTAPAPLAVQGGLPRTWTSTDPGGHYQNGGFFYYQGKLNYVPQWREPTGIRANIVTVGL